MGLQWNYVYMVRDNTITMLNHCLSALFIEPSQTTVTPTSQEVSAGETASFNCSGVGSFIRIKWRFNNTLTCNGESCDSDLLSYHQEIRVNSSNNLTIDSSVTVNVGQLKAPVTFIIECKVEQIMPASLNLSGEDHVNFANLRIIHDGMF